MFHQRNFEFQYFVPINADWRHPLLNPELHSLTPQVWHFAMPTGESGIHPS